jgi:protein gp37
MAANSKIEWTQCTWNPVTGCTKISPGCQHCYAERMSKRLCAMGQANYRNGFQLTPHPHMLDLPLHWRQPRMIFVNSMSDLFHKDVSLEFILKVFDVMQRSPQHCFQVLTKRSKRLVQLNSRLPWPGNVWMGVTVENDDYTFRIEDLKQTGAAVKFISFEPLLGPISDVSLDDIEWAIVGGESGPGARPMQPEWVTGIRDRCQAEEIPFFFKQWGGVNKKANGRTLDKRIWNEKPQATMRREANHAGIGATCG